MNYFYGIYVYIHVLIKLSNGNLTSTARNHNEESFLLQLTHVVKQVFFDFLSVFYFVLLLLFHVFAYLVKETS
jgi:hypothetical protein